MKGRILVIAGSDPSGGAGLQADIKTVTALGGYAAAAVTALTVQNTKGVSAVHAVPPAIIRDQIIAVLEDIGADAIKIGMIGSPAAGAAILDALEACGRTPSGEGAPIVLDPVLAATSGDALASDDLVQFLKFSMLAKTLMATPNIPEAEALTGLEITGVDDQRRAAGAILDMGGEAVLLKGGHGEGTIVTDVLLTQRRETLFENPRIETTSTHGTGCTLASAIATGLAQGMTLEAACARAITYVREAIRTAPGFGAGAGPLNHAHGIRG